MAVGDYVHSKDAGQPRPITGDRSHQRLPRQLLAQQARVMVPTTKLPGFTAPGFDERTSFEHRGPTPLSSAQQSQQHVAQNESDAYKDTFDTDVEGVDDSTIAGTSIVEVENSQVNAPIYSNGYHYRRPHEGSTYDYVKSEGLGDRTMKASGFDTDEAEADESQLGSSLHEDDDDDDDNAEDADGEQTQTINWNQTQNYPLAEGSMKRVEDFWLASRRSFPKPSNPVAGETSSARAVVSDAVKISQPSYMNGNKTNAFQPTVAVAPKGRFSPPKPPSYARYLLSPTRRASGPRPQPGRPASMAELHLTDGRQPRPLPGGLERRHSTRSADAFDVTDVEALDEDTMDNPSSPDSSRPASVIQSTAPSTTKKRQFEPDYPPEVLNQKPFSDLQSESFDYIPARTPPAAPASPPPQPQVAQTAAERIALLLKLPDQDRHAYLSSLSIDEWEDCGDELISQFSTILTKMKEARQARRKTAAVFEAEIQRRHEEVQDEDKDLGTKLAEMREGGLGVLRGRTP